MEGTLSKWTNMMQGWQNRHFFLDEHAGILSYYTVCIPWIIVNLAELSRIWFIDLSQILAVTREDAQGQSARLHPPARRHLRHRRWRWTVIHNHSRWKDIPFARFYLTILAILNILSLYHISRKRRRRTRALGSRARSRYSQAFRLLSAGTRGENL